MNTVIIVFTSLLAGLAAAALLWFSADFFYKLNYVMKQRSRAKKLAKREADAAAKDEAKEKKKK